MGAHNDPLRLIQSVAIIALLSYFGLLLVLYLLQDRLIFFPRSLPESERTRIADRVATAEEVQFNPTAGVRLRGWLLHAATPGRAPLVIYFGGNAEEVSWLVGYSLWPPGWSVALINYRGYGASEGVPGERALFSDATFIYDRLRRRTDIDPTRIVAFGRSLGSGVAVHLAAERPVAGVILVSPYDSMQALASDAYPWLPVRWLLRHPFDSLALAPRIRVPLIAVVGAADKVIPAVHSQRLANAWAGPERTLSIPRAGHNNVSEQPAYEQAIQQFLEKIAGQ